VSPAHRPATSSGIARHVSRLVFQRLWRRIHHGADPQKQTRKIHVVEHAWASLGGSIIKDKFFYFVDGEHTLQQEEAPVLVGEPFQQSH
jgi:hypothetical protein